MDFGVSPTEICNGFLLFLSICNLFWALYLSWAAHEELRCALSSADSGKRQLCPSPLSNTFLEGFKNSTLWNVSIFSLLEESWGGVNSFLLRRSTKPRGAQALLGWASCCCRQRQCQQGACSNLHDFLQGHPPLSEDTCEGQSLAANYGAVEAPGAACSDKPVFFTTELLLSFCTCRAILLWLVWPPGERYSANHSIGKHSFNHKAQLPLSDDNSLFPMPGKAQKHYNNDRLHSAHISTALALLRPLRSPPRWLHGSTPAQSLRTGQPELTEAPQFSERYRKPQQGCTLPPGLCDVSSCLLSFLMGSIACGG